MLPVLVRVNVTWKLGFEVELRLLTTARDEAGGIGAAEAEREERRGAVRAEALVADVCGPRSDAPNRYLRREVIPMVAMTRKAQANAVFGRSGKQPHHDPDLRERVCQEARIQMVTGWQNVHEGWD